MVNKYNDDLEEVKEETTLVSERNHFLKEGNALSKYLSKP
jgi:hypothetical protein